MAMSQRCVFFCFGIDRNEKDQEYCRYRNNPGEGDVSELHSPCDSLRVVPAIDCLSLSSPCFLAFSILLCSHHTQWRAPEEYMDKPLNEKIDVWSLGMNMYALLTGVNPFYDELTTEVVQQMVVDEERPYIDPRYRSRSFAEGQLVEIMERCWTYDPNERPDIFEVVRLLKAAYDMDKRHQVESGETNVTTAMNATLPASS
jgi:serine/threonine protein kinase